MQQGLVEPLEVERECQCLAHTYVGEFLAAEVEGECTEARGGAGLKHVERDRAIAGGGKVVLGSPARRVSLIAEVVVATLKGLECDGGVAEVIEPDRVEVVLPAVHA